MRTNLTLCMLLALPVSGLTQAPPTPLEEGGSAAPALSTQQQLAQWQQATPAQRAELRQRYQAWRELGEAERDTVRRARAQFVAMPAANQQKLQAQYQAMDRLHRDGWLLGPTLGMHYPQLQPLFGYVPSAQRPALLALLRGLNDEQLAQLAMISQRTPPQKRDAVRTELLAQPPQQRAGWLRAMVAQ